MAKGLIKKWELGQICQSKDAKQGMKEMKDELTRHEARSKTEPEKDPNSLLKCNYESFNLEGSVLEVAITSDNLTDDTELGKAYQKYATRYESNISF